MIKGGNGQILPSKSNIKMTKTVKPIIGAL